MNHICTWLCADRKGEESDFPQSGRKSSSQKHQDIYWRCLIVFFITSKRFNKLEQHVLFTNLTSLPIIDGTPVADTLSALDVQIVPVEFKHKTPKGYFGAFQNQFFEFSILEHIAKSNSNPKDLYLILDSDCIFVRPAHGLFKAAQANGYISFEIDSPVSHKINGLSRMDMKGLFAELLGRPVDDVPAYHLGEFFLCNTEIIEKLVEDFSLLWPQLLLRNAAGKLKLNEEAHTLSYLFYKNDLHPSKDNTYIKRIWTNPVFYRNVSVDDSNLVIWHLPAEKTFGIAKLFRVLMKEKAFGNGLSKAEFTELLCRTFGIPSISGTRKAEYYVVSYYKALRKRLLKRLSF
jgi:hypothetical protein